MPQKIIRKKRQKPILEKPLTKKHITETISDKLVKYQASSFSGPDLIPVGLQLQVSDDYSQVILLKRINLYLQSIPEEPILEDGYCHGIILLWLTMMSWGVESLFYKMIKLITECPTEQLAQIGNILALFLDLIDVGQNPDAYSDKTCTQRNVDKIIGQVSKIFSATRKFSQKQLENKLKELARENNMIAITRWWLDKENHQEEGHTVGVFIRSPCYHFFDSNFKDLGDLQYTSEEALVKKIWEKVFDDFEIKSRKREKFSLHVVHQRKPGLIAEASPRKSYAPTFFNERGVCFHSASELFPDAKTRKNTI